MSSEHETILRLVHLRKLFRRTVAVDDLSLDVSRGELVCLLGPSGCGKTTALRMIAGFLTPTEGKVVIAGVDVTTTPPHRRDTGMVFQNYALFPHLTVAENVAFGLRNLRLPAPERNTRVREMLSMVELDHLSDRMPRQLSGGQQQRVALARALAVRPAVLLLDEPLSNLDAQLRMRMGEEIRTLIRRLEMTTIFVTHDQEEALALADRIAVMNRGLAEQIASPQELYERPASQFVAQFIGLCNLLEGIIVDAEPGGLRVQTDHGLHMTARAERTGAAVGDRVVVAIRPEHIMLAKQDGGPNRFPARLGSSTYLGSICRHRLTVQGHEITMERHMTERGLIVEDGDLTVTWDPSCALLLPRLGAQDSGSAAVARTEG